MDAPARNESELILQIEDFFRSSQRGLEAKTLIEQLSHVGDVGIFGGMIRDFARAGSACFTSDVDLVVDAESAHLTRFLSRFDGKRNKFGGYRIAGKFVEFDIWALNDTWAVKEGHVVAHSLVDLTKTTFFNWDAAVFNCRTQNLFCASDYFDSLQSGVVDLNLEQNPNPLGAIARILRLLIDWQVEISLPLTEYLWKQVELYAPRELVDAQKRTLGRVSIRERSIPALRRMLRERDFFDKSFRYERKKRPSF